MKKEVYLNEYNVFMEGSTYFPFVSGILKANAFQFPHIRENYQFESFVFYRDNLENVIKKYKNPSVVGFSVSMWNEQLSLKVAQIVKNKFPECIIIFGGPQVPHKAEEYFRRYPFIDIAVRSEGEECFAEILIRFLESRDFSGIAGISFRDPITKVCVRNPQEREQSKDLDVYPSPYLTGCFDDLITEYPDIRFQAIIETNRGCPFPCAFCFWGQGGLSRKYRFHSPERIQQIIDWCGKNKIEYVFNADSNFGMHPRDYQIAEFLVEAKKKYGFPEKFRTCFGKNTDEKIYKVATLLHAHGLEKGITLARQSNDENTLKNINRQNIKLETYKTLQVRFNEGNIPVYTELILGLPGETCETWLKGIDNILESGIKNQLFVYHAQVYPNTEFGDKAYQEKFKIELTKVPLSEIHGAVRPGYLLTEYEDIITKTESMSREDWKRMTIFSWVLQVFHSLKLAYYVMIYLHLRCGVKYSDFIKFVSEKQMSKECGSILRSEVEKFEKQVENILAQKGRMQVLREYGDIYWDEDEASFLKLSEKLGDFYQDLHAIVKDFLSKQKVEYSPEELVQVMEYQRLRIPPQQGTSLEGKKTFSYNLPEFFDNCFTSHHVPLKKAVQIVELVEPRDFKGDRREYAKQIILWGRKSGTILNRTRWIEPSSSNIALPETETYQYSSSI